MLILTDASPGLRLADSAAPAIQAAHVLNGAQEASDYPPDPYTDTPWPLSAGSLLDVQAAFNRARGRESSELGIAIPPLLFPAETDWTAMSQDARVAWLVNRERVDRGVAPLDGSEASVDGVAGAYAQYLFDHDAFSHDADGRNPWQRLSDHRAIGACHDFLGVAENLMVMAGQGPSYQPFPLERAIYGWMYEGQAHSWGHRHMLLWRSYTDNSGAGGVEGFLGIGLASGGPYQGPFDRAYPHADIVVLNVFDPCAVWAYPAPQSYLPAVGR